MHSLDAAAQLDSGFGIGIHAENLVDWAVTDDNRGYVTSDFLDRRTALMLRGSPEIDTVRTAVFVTDPIVRQLEKLQSCLLVTHHNFDYYEDARGVMPITSNMIRLILEHGHSLYVAHAPLDTHPRYGTSLALAELVGVPAEQFFYDYFGSPVALVGTIPTISFGAFSEAVRTSLRRPCLTLVQYRNEVNRVAVVAGGGDMPDILQQAFDLGCDTMLTGTVEHRWGLPAVQEGNKRFHELNQRLKMNLVGGTHYGTERPAMQKLIELFADWPVRASYLEDEVLLSSL